MLRHANACGHSASSFAVLRVDLLCFVALHLVALLGVMVCVDEWVEEVVSMSGLGRGRLVEYLV